jgi:hypothetical protein
MTAMIRADRVELEATDWLIPNRVPFGMLTLLAGKPKAGKSLCTAWLAAEATRQGHRVIFSNQEDHISQTLVPRLAFAKGHDAKGVVLLCFEDLSKPGEWCHRRAFATWWEEQTGEKVEELS